MGREAMPQFYKAHPRPSSEGARSNVQKAQHLVGGETSLSIEKKAVNASHWRSIRICCCSSKREIKAKGHPQRRGKREDRMVIAELKGESAS